MAPPAQGCLEVRTKAARYWRESTTSLLNLPDRLTAVGEQPSDCF